MECPYCNKNIYEMTNPITVAITLTNVYECSFLSNFLDIDQRDLKKLDNLLTDYLTHYSALSLQDYIGMKLKEEYNWMTSIGLIEAMNLVIKDSIANGNIKR